MPFIQLCCLLGYDPRLSITVSSLSGHQSSANQTQTQLGIFWCWYAVLVGSRPHALEENVVVNILHAEGTAGHRTNTNMDAGLIIAVHLQGSSSIICASPADALQRARQLLAVLPSNTISALQVGGVHYMCGCCLLLGSLLLRTSHTLPSSLLRLSAADALAPCRHRQALIGTPSLAAGALP